MNKTTYVKKIQTVVTQLANLLPQMGDLKKAYFDRGHNTGGANEIIDADIQDTTGVSASNVISAINMFEQFTNFYDNQPVVQSDYKSTLNKVRNDF